MRNSIHTKAIDPYRALHLIMYIYNIVISTQTQIFHSPLIYTQRKAFIFAIHWNCQKLIHKGLAGFHGDDPRNVDIYPTWPPLHCLFCPMEWNNARLNLRMAVNGLIGKIYYVLRLHTHKVWKYLCYRKYETFFFAL